MEDLLLEFARLAPHMVWGALATALTMAAAVVAERTVFGLRRARTRRLAHRYRPLVQRAVAGDEAARGALRGSPARHRLALAWLLIEPLIEDRDPERIARTRAIAQELSVFALAGRYLRSRLWWRRALALRALGLTQARDHTAHLISALDDPHPDVRAAALDGLADMRDPAALPAIIVRIHDTSLPRGRRGAALEAFGAEGEPLLLELAEVDSDNRLNCIHALAICGTARSRPLLCRFTLDPRVDVRATAYEALAHVGLDDEAARVAVEGLESDDAHVRAMAAYALSGWQGPGDAAERLAPHLDDTWAVAVRAARTLQSMGPAGAAALQSRASRPGTGGLLARQMLWAPGAGGVTSSWPDALVAFSFLFTAYFVLWHASQIAMSPLAIVVLWRHRRRHTRRARRLPSAVAVPPLVSIVVPAHDEELTIVDSIRALLALDYEPREVVVVNDGSTDRTLAVLQETFQLVPAPLAFDQPLPAAPVRGVYRSVREPDLVVIDKHNGGSKADAVNAGINVASGTLVLTIDADTVLEADALSRAVLPFLEDPETVAVGANVAVANGCRIEAGRIATIALPRSWLARFQVVEYMRAFLLFRLACVSRNAVVIISGAFGLFRRSAVIAVGGYDRTAIGEDIDLTVRLQRHFRERGEPFRIVFDPNPLAWTQAPEDARSLRSQRYRWRRGLLQTLWRHRRMIGNPRFGIVGLGSLPYVAFFEGLGPLIESAGYVVTISAVALGYLDWPHFGAMLAVSVLLGASVTLLAVLLSDFTTRQYVEGRDLGLLVAVAVLESFGYRQLNALWGCVGTVKAMTGAAGWGAMKRRRFRG